MNEDTPALTRTPPTDMPAAAAQPAVPAANTAPAARSGLALVVALVACGLAGWASWQAWDTRTRTLDLREELAQRLSAGESIALESRGIVRQQQESLSALQGKLGALESKLEATDGQAAALEALYQSFSRTREDAVVAEVEQALAAAAQHLQLAGNLQAALIALQGAENRLALHDRGQLAPLRRALAKDVEQLRLQPVIDVPGLGLRLERLLERTDALPLAFEGQLQARPATLAPDQAVATDLPGRALALATGLARELWREISSLVRIERLDQSEPVLLAPAQNTFLRENLKIRLLTARLALLARDGRTYAADLAQARLWIERFFDLRDEQVQLSLVELKALEGIALVSEVPTLSESFAALQRLQARPEAQPVLPPVAAPAAAPQPAAQP